MKKMFLFLFCFLVSYNVYSNVPLDTIINLKEVIVLPTKYKQIVSKTKGVPISVRAKNHISIFSLVPLNENKIYRITGVEFYFSAEGNNKKYNGFYVRPLLYTSNGSKPLRNLLDNNAICYANKRIKNKFYFDFLDYNIVFKNTDKFFIGLSFPDKNEDIERYNFNIKMGNSKIKDVLSYLSETGDINSSVSFDIGGNTTLKYKIYYTEEIE